MDTGPCILVQIVVWVPLSISPCCEQRFRPTPICPEPHCRFERRRSWKTSQAPGQLVLARWSRTEGGRLQMKYHRADSIFTTLPKLLGFWYFTHKSRSVPRKKRVLVFQVMQDLCHQQEETPETREPPWRTIASYLGAVGAHWSGGVVGVWEVSCSMSSCLQLL